MHSNIQTNKLTKVLIFHGERTQKIALHRGTHARNTQSFTTQVGSTEEITTANENSAFHQVEVPRQKGISTRQET